VSDWVTAPAVFPLRALQTIALCSPTLLCGMLTAGFFRAVFGEGNVHRWLGRGTPGDLSRAAAIGTLLPVCSIGVLPVLLTLHAMGVRRGPLVVLALTGPLVTPWTLGYCLDRAGLSGGGLLLAGNALIALAAGWTAGQTADDVAAEPVTFPSKSISLNLLWSAGRSFDRRVLSLLIIGAAGSGAVAVFIPPNAVGDGLVERTLAHATALSIVPLLTYVNPEMAALQAGEVVHASNMPGLVIPLVALGSAVHLGTLVLLVKAAGARTAIKVAGTVFAAALACGVASDVVLYDPAYSPEDSHAFEDFGRPFHLLDHPSGPIAGFTDRLRRPLGLNQLLAGVGVVVLAVAASKLPNRGRRADHAAGEGTPSRHADSALLIAVAAMLLITIYTYVPPPTPLANELQAAAAEFGVAYRRNDPPQRAGQLVRQIDRRLGQVRPSMLLRGRSLSDQDQKRLADLRQRLHALAAAPPSEESREAELQFQRNMIRVVKTLRS
jgi:uncharacterized protein